MAVPVRMGVELLVVCAMTVGTTGAMVSTINSLIVESVLVLPARSVIIAVTSYVSSASALAEGIVKVQVPSPLSIKFPSPAT